VRQTEPFLLGLGEVTGVVMVAIKSTREGQWVKKEVDARINICSFHDMKAVRESRRDDMISEKERVKEGMVR
jgi:hypothetical protein